MMRIDILTIFPKMFSAVLNESIIKRAQRKGKVEIFLHDLRDFSADKHRKVDDRPFGGGPGMLLRPEPIFSALEHILPHRPKRPRAEVILLSPRGKKFNQQMAMKLSRCRHLIFICGHYEGVDERVRQARVDEEISIGDYVLTGGELPAMVVIDCLIRQIPGVLGEKNSLQFESFKGNLLEYPQFTRPGNYKGMRVPRVLLSGDHLKIEQWRQRQAIKVTKQRRPEMLKE